MASSMPKTECAGLNQWMESDIPEMEDFNQDNLNIDNQFIKISEDLDSKLAELQDSLATNQTKPTTQLFTLTSTGWTGSAAPYTQTVSIAGVTASTIGICDVNTTATAAQVTAFSAAGVWQYSQADNNITFRAAGVKPTVNIPMKLLIVG